MRISDRKINTILKKQIEKTFVQTVVDFKNIKETEKFLRDFFTSSEFEIFAKRIAVGYWLKKKRSYGNIKENLKVSSATIAQISELSKKKGFQLAIKKIEAEEWATKWSEKIKNLGKRKK